MSEDDAYFRIVDQDLSYQIYMPDAEHDHIQKMIAENRAPYEQEMLRDMASRIMDGDWVLDIGANVGNHTLYLAAVGANVIAYEPNTHLADALRKSIEVNLFIDRVSVRSMGVGRLAGTARFQANNPENLGAQKLEAGEGPIQIVCLDSEVFKYRIRMIKIDVEGMELDVLDGAKALIRRDKPLIYVESQNEIQFRNVARWMQRHSYSYWETFNATPTHLYRPAEDVSIEERLERLLAREVIQDYRYGVQLRRARRLQRKSDEHAKTLALQVEDREAKEIDDARARATAELTCQIAELRRDMQDTYARAVDAHEKQMSVRLESVRYDYETAIEAERKRVDELQKDLERRGRQIRDLRASITRSTNWANELSQSTAYQVGLALTTAATSGRAALSLPFTLARLLKRAIGRRKAANYGSQQLITAAVAPRDTVKILQRWLEMNPGANRAVSLLYADIDLNIVDGSSVWLSSMASVLCSKGHCILISKMPVRSDIVTSNISNPERLTILSPDEFRESDVLSINEVLDIICELDGLLPRLRKVVIRGLEAAYGIVQTRQFHGRIALYLTDFYTLTGNGREVSKLQRKMVSICLIHAKEILVQTPEIEHSLREISGREFRAVQLPPPVPPGHAMVTLRPHKEGGVIRIGYAGKVNSRWGVIELLSWTEQAIANGHHVELHIATDNINNGPDPGFENLDRQVLQKINKIGAHHHKNLNREASIRLLSMMDFVWCWRPARLEDHTLELSTKLVEMAALGARCICYPSAINQAALGFDYPFYIKSSAEFHKIVSQSEWALPSPGVAKSIEQQHSLERIAEVVGAEILPDIENSAASNTILFTGHDMKFIDTYASSLKASGVSVLREPWEWGEPRGGSVSKVLADQAQVVFCEWGLANAVHYSRTLARDKRLIVRVHAQEVRERARKFGEQIDQDRVDHFVFVSEEIRRKAIGMFGWAEEKTSVIPNYVLENEFTMTGRIMNPVLTLGMVGIVPGLKRLDRALDLLSILNKNGIVTRLKIKGHRPEQLEFMKVPGRKKEMDYYEAQYKRIDTDEMLQGKVEFEPWGNDLAIWYKGVDIILSCSESESFHYALADGVLSGCYPIVWPWPGASAIYPPNWIVDDLPAAVSKARCYFGMAESDRQISAVENRNVVISRYSTTRIFEQLNNISAYYDLDSAEV